MNNSKLAQISEPINENLSLFNDFFKEAISSKTPLVDLVVKYILKTKGKKIRPLLVMLCAHLIGEINERSYRGAVLVELLHTATLVHDDVVDDSDKRRGFPSINAVWKNKIAVLMGDYLLAKGLMISVENEDFDFLKKMTNTVKRMSEGELLQIQKTRKLDIDEETYFKVISDKTASLISTCCVIGAMSVTDDPDTHKKMSDFGEYLGLAFQIQDDILDFEGSSKLFGKPVGADIKEKKITLPLIYAMQIATEQEVKDIKKTIKKIKKKDSVEKILEFVRKYDGIDKAKRTANELADKAISIIKMFDHKESSDSLTKLVQYVVERKK